MNTYRLGFWTLIVYLLVDFGQVHHMIPGLVYLKLGFLSQSLLILLVFVEFFRFRWLKSVAVWRLLFLCSMATGLIFGITQGLALVILKSEIPRFVAGFLGVCLFVRRLDDLKFLHNTFIALSFMIALWVITHGGHGPGLYADENDAALMLVMFLPFSFLRIFSDKSPRTVAICLLVFFATLVGIGMTLSRGGMVGALPALFLCWMKSSYKAVSLILVSVMLVGSIFLAPETLFREFHSISATDSGTAKSRIYFWELSIQLFQERPIFGVGAGSWGNALYSGLIPEPPGKAHKTPHSIYFQLLSELGLVGVICWLGLLGSTFAALNSLRGSKLGLASAYTLANTSDNPLMVRKSLLDRLFMHNFSVSLVIGIIGFLVCGAFLSVLYYPALYLFAALAQASRESWKTEMIIAQISNNS